MILKHLFSIFTLIVVSFGTAATAQQFPASIQNCIDRGDCTTPVLVRSVPFFGPSLMNQYRYTDGGTDKILYRYSVGENSGFQGRNDREGAPDFEQAVFSGDVWLSANESYNLNVGGMNHQMTLYTDQISGGDNTGNTEFRGDITLWLSSEALLAGGGFFSFNSFMYNSFGEDGGLSSDGPVLCLSEGCSIGAQFNLVNVNYEQVGALAVTGVVSSFANLEGQFLYSQESGFPGFLFFYDDTPSQFFDHQSSLFVGTPVLLGDCNLDGIVDFGDIPSLIQVLQSGDFLPQADCNQDGLVDFADIPRFVAILSNS